MVAASSRPRTNDPISPESTSSQLENKWRLWVSGEVQRRAILGHYVLDGLLTDFSGQPTATRHTANPVLLPSRDSIFEAKSADQWRTEMSKGDECDMSFSNLYIALFDQRSKFQDFHLPYLSIRVILEALQSLIYEHHEAGGCTIGTPSKTDIARALVRLHQHHISILPSLQERVEHSIRWHVICIRLAVETAALAKQICDLYNIPQDLHEYEAQTMVMTDFSGWLETSDAPRALLHAISLADLGWQLNLGRAHAVHLPMAIYTAAVIYTAVIVNACQRGRRPVITVPRVDDWNEVWTRDIFMSASDLAMDHNSVNVFVSVPNGSIREGWVRKNVLDELNGLYLIMEQLRPYCKHHYFSNLKIQIACWNTRSQAAHSCERYQVSLTLTFLYSFVPSPFRLEEHANVRTTRVGGVTTQMSKIMKQWLSIPTLLARH